VATTLTYSSTTLTLPDDLLWTDEFAWTPVTVSSSYSAGGSLLINRGVKLAGRPITLQGGATWAWMDRTTALALLDWVAISGAQFTLSYRSVSYTVKFSPNAAPLEVSPVVDYTDPDGSDFYFATMRFVVVS
jgi:hypothetical protein